MKLFLFVKLFIAATMSTALAADYNETLTRYKIWPMASAAYGDHPEICVKDNFADAQVATYQFYFHKV